MTTVFRDEKGSALTADEFDANHGPKFTQGSHGFSVGDVVYRSSASAYTKALATAAGTLGEAIVAYVADSSNFRVISISGSHVDWTHGKGSPPQKLWLSQSTAGEVVTSKPSNGYIQQIGSVVDADTVMWRPDPVGEFV
jgi:hypothetical protein